jgi:hypothetical protein
MRMLPESRLGRAAVAGLALAIAAGAGAVAFALISSSRSPLSFAGSGVDFSGARVYPGQTESFAAFVTANPPGVAFQVLKVSLIPLPGFRTPRLVGAMFLVNIRDTPLSARGFPPRNSTTDQPYPVHAIGRYTVRSGIHPYQPPLTLEYGLKGNDLGGYAVAGIRIIYLVDGRSYTADIYNGADLFYYPQHQSRADRRASWAAYSSYDDRAANALFNLPASRAVLAAMHH